MVDAEPTHGDSEKRRASMESDGDQAREVATSPSTPCEHICFPGESLIDLFVRLPQSLGGVSSSLLPFLRMHCTGSAAASSQAMDVGLCVQWSVEHNDGGQTQEEKES